MEQARLRIGELSRLSGLSAPTIRFYEEEGLLAPIERTESGYRLYEDEAVGRLQFIRRAKALGLRLDEIREIVASPDASGEQTELRHRIAHRLSELQAQQAELRTLEETLRALYVRLMRHECGCRHAGDCDCLSLPPTPAETRAVTAEVAHVARSTCTCGDGEGHADGAACECECCYSTAGVAFAGLRQLPMARAAAEATARARRAGGPARS